MLTRAEMVEALERAAVTPYERTAILVLHPRDWARAEQERRPGESDIELIARLIREGA